MIEVHPPAQSLAAVDWPIWNSEALAERPDAAVFITASATSARAAEAYFPQYIALAGPLAADWRCLKGRAVHLWPDAGEAGEAEMRKLAETLRFVAAKITLHRQDGQQAGWTLAHALDEGMPKDELMAYVRRDEDGHVILLKAGKVKKTAALIEGESSEVQNDINLQRDARGLPFPTEANVLEILGKHEKFRGRIWLDEFSRRIMYDDKRFDTDREGIEAMIWMQKNLDMHKLSLSSIKRAAAALASVNLRHPIKDYLESLTWDGADRLSGFMANVYGAERSGYSEAVGRCWLVSAVARIYEPGCKADCMLVLEGGQGIFKSTSLHIIGGDWFTESHEDPVDQRKDFLGQLQGRWIIEIPEMHSIGNRTTGVEKLKGILSCQTDDYRRPWGDSNVEYPRQCIFAGTTNLKQWNSDPTGGRRFWPILCGKIDLDYLKEYRDQLWAEALSRYRAHEKWWDIPLDEALAQQDLRRTSDSWEPIIEMYVTHIPTHNLDRSITWYKRERPLPYLQSQLILIEAIGKSIAQCTKHDEMRLASILNTLGYRRERIAVNGKRPYVYRLETPAPATREVIETPDPDDVPY